MSQGAYVLVTPVRDEATTIGETLASVVSQTRLPSEWIIVSNNSCDGTDEIVRRASAKHPWIRLLHLTGCSERSFAAVVHATEYGCRSVTGNGHEYIGLLDADVRFPATYFEELIGRFEAAPTLGLGGGLVVDVVAGRRIWSRQNLQDVAGAVQFFRRECFEAMNGMIPIPEGGWDAITCVQARMNGFEAKTFPELIVEHLKPRNASFGNPLRRNWQFGIREYVLGNYPLFEFAKCCGRIFEKPVLGGAMARLAGYGWSWLTRRPRILPEAVMRFVRADQRKRLRSVFGLSGAFDERGNGNEKHAGSPSLLILGASYETGNMGVDALLSGTIAAALHACPQARISLLDYGTEASERVVHTPSGSTVVRMVNIRFSKNIFIKNHVLRLVITALVCSWMPRRLRERWISKNAWLREVASADVIGSLAGGDSFTDIYGVKRLLYVTLPQFLVLALGRKLILLPQTLGPFGGAFCRKVSRRILLQAKAVYARDKESARVAEELAGKHSVGVQLAYDMGFALTPVPPTDFDSGQWRAWQEEGPVIGVNVSGLLYMGGYNQENMFGLRANYPKLVRAIIQLFIDAGAHVIMVPHVSGVGSDPESDWSACEELFRQAASASAGRLHCVTAKYSHQQTKYIIGRCDFFLGSRMHACIAALSQCVPAVGLAYSRKFRGVFDTIGMGELSIDLRKEGGDEVQAAVQVLFHKRETIRRKLVETIPSVKSAVLGLFDEHLGGSLAGGSLTGLQSKTIGHPRVPRGSGFLWAQDSYGE